MKMDTATAIDVIDVLLDELVFLHILPVKRYEDMSKEDRERLVKLLVTRYGEKYINGLPDPTYIRDEIRAKPAWELAFVISELQNDNAPIGWSRYVRLAEGMLGNYKMSKREEK